MTKAEFLNLINTVKDNGELEEICGNRIKTEIWNYKGWSYSFLYSNGVCLKIEEYNHRELNELWWKDCK